MPDAAPQFPHRRFIQPVDMLEDAGGSSVRATIRMPARRQSAKFLPGDFFIAGKQPLRLRELNGQQILGG